MLWLKALHQGLASPFRAPSAPCHLPHQLERALCRAQVRSLQAKICVDDPHKREQREVVPLRHKLRAEDYVRLPSGDFFDPLFQRASRAKEIRTEHRDAGLWEKCRRLFAQPFDTGANGGHLAFDLAGWAFGRHRFGFTALVAHQTFHEPVLDHACITVIAGHLRATGPADRHRRKAATVQEQEGLLAAFESEFHRVFQRRRYPSGGQKLLAAHINRAHFGQHRLTKARRQIEALVFARLRVRPCLKARCR